MMNIRNNQVWKHKVYGREYTVIQVLDDKGGSVRLESMNEPKARLKMLDITLMDQFELVQDA